MSRISDARARQFWDPKHLISGELTKLATQMSSAPKVGFGERFYWDMAIVFAPHVKWENVPPVPSFWQGPVYRVIPGLETALDNAVHQTQ